MERRKCLIKSLKNELWNFMVDTHAYCTHFIIDRSINVSLWTGCLLGKARIGMSRLYSATFEQLFAFGATFFGSSNFKQLFPFCAIFEQLFTKVQTLQYEMFTCDRQHFTTSFSCFSRAKTLGTRLLHFL